MRSVMVKAQALAVLFPLMLTACTQGAFHPDDAFSSSMTPLDLKDLDDEQVARYSTTVAGVDIWTVGLPDKKYRILGMIQDIRRNAGFDVERYYQDIAKITQRAGGNAAVIVLAESKLVMKDEYDCESGATTECGSNGREAMFYNDNREPTDVPLEYRESRIMVAKYVN